jgi:hypothetical protein
MLAREHITPPYVKKTSELFVIATPIDSEATSPAFAAKARLICRSIASRNVPRLRKLNRRLVGQRKKAHLHNYLRHQVCTRIRSIIDLGETKKSIRFE